MTTPGISDLTYLQKSLSAFRIVETGSYTYIGKCAPENYEKTSEPVWQILRIDSTLGEGSKFASNTREANKIWDNRESYF